MLRVTLPGLLLAAGATALPSASQNITYGNTTAGYSPFKGTVDYVQLNGQATIEATSYTLEATYDSSNWFDSFTVQNLGTADPTGGFVNYVSQSAAESGGLYKVENDQVYIGVDHSTVLDASGTGRNSVRIGSNTAYTHGLFILDLAHMPGSICGSWPAYWLVGPDWPTDGEIDIIEGVNTQSTNIMTLHTAAGCTVVVGEGGQTGSSGNSNCNANSAYDGCGVTSNTANSYGTGFNNAGGGVYATFWNEGSIQHWYWPASSVPSDIRDGAPAPAGWGTPMANYSDCDFDTYMIDHNIIFDVTFCGTWAGAVWGSSTCPASTGQSSCAAYVAANPTAFSETYWLINSLKVYTVPT